MSYLPEIYRSGGPLSRKEERALARQMGATAAELLAVDRVQLVERAKVRAIGGVASDAIDEVVRLADEVALCAERNPFGAQLAARLACDAERAFARRIERANERLG
jgi:hypothetical protein